MPELDALLGAQWVSDIDPPLDPGLTGGEGRRAVRRRQAREEVAGGVRERGLDADWVGDPIQLADGVVFERGRPPEGIGDPGDLQVVGWIVGQRSDLPDDV